MLQALFDGLFAGSIYALVALALTITYQPTRIMNFAQGEAFILGAGSGFLFLGVYKWNFFLGFLVMILLSLAMGLLQERMIILPVQLSKSRFAWIIATLAAALIFQAIFSIRFVGDTLQFNPPVAGPASQLGCGAGCGSLGISHTDHGVLRKWNLNL